MVDEPNEFSGSSWSGPTAWSSWRSRDFFAPPLWHFHRVLAGRREDEVTNKPDLVAHVLQVDGIDWFCRENGSVNHTDRYELVQDRKACVARRGGSIRIGIQFKGNRQFDLNRDKLKLTFEFGQSPSYPKGTKASAEMVRGKESELDADVWSVLFDRKSGQRVDAVVKIPVDLPVGLWRLSVTTWYGDRMFEQKVFHSPDPFYVLFNPFHTGDPVFLNHPSGADEYLFNEVGKIYHGSHNKVKGRPWIYGQLRDSVLPAVCYVMDRIASLRDAQRGDPVKVVRAISALVNSNDDDGILVGRWDGHYERGTSPFHWTGSVAILEEFAETGKPVKYGQCWVFAGVVTTICRCLGIPCRPVTNFVSAHDTNNSLSVDKFVDHRGEDIMENTVGAIGQPNAANGDSVWNFHVWNEAWMARADLPSGYGGWQVIDATPQEESDSQCIPLLKPSPFSRLM